MVGMLVPLKGGMVGGIVHPPIGSIYHLLYILLIVLAFWGVKNATYHLLGEPETTIDLMMGSGFDLYPQLGLSLPS